MRSIINWLLNRNDFPVTKHAIKYAFTVGGKEYFEFEDFNNVPALRGLKTMVFYTEMQCKCTQAFLKLHTEAIDNILNQSKINIFEIKKLNDQLKQRLDLALDTELLYKIASINFFDKKENLEDYDFGYNAKKVEHWKKHGGADFFLQQPLQELLPVLKSIEGNLEMYSQTVEKLNDLHWESLLSNLPDTRKQTFVGRNYFSATAIPQSLN